MQWDRIISNTGLARSVCQFFSQPFRRESTGIFNEMVWYFPLITSLCRHAPGLSEDIHGASLQQLNVHSKTRRFQQS